MEKTTFRFPVCVLRRRHETEQTHDGTQPQISWEEDMENAASLLEPLLQCSWQPDEEFFARPIRIVEILPIGTQYGAPLANFVKVQRCAVTMALDPLARELLLQMPPPLSLCDEAMIFPDLARKLRKRLENVDEKPFPGLAELRTFALPGKTLFNCCVPVLEFCGVLVAARHRERFPVELRAQFARSGTAYIDAVFEGEDLAPDHLRFALYQFGACDADV